MYRAVPSLFRLLHSLELAAVCTGGAPFRQWSWAPLSMTSLCALRRGRSWPPVQQLTAPGQGRNSTGLLTSPLLPSLPDSGGNSCFRPDPAPQPHWQVHSCVCDAGSGKRQEPGAAMPPSSPPTPKSEGKSHGSAGTVWPGSDQRGRDSVTGSSPAKLSVQGPDGSGFGNAPCQQC